MPKEEVHPRDSFIAPLARHSSPPRPRKRKAQLFEKERRRRQVQTTASRGFNESLTVAEWCALRKVSRAMLYKLWALGQGPRRHYAGSKVLISAKADAEWLTEREAAAA